MGQLLPPLKRICSFTCVVFFFIRLEVWVATRFYDSSLFVCAVFNPMFICKAWRISWKLRFTIRLVLHKTWETMPRCTFQTPRFFTKLCRQTGGRLAYTSLASYKARRATCRHFSLLIELNSSPSSIWCHLDSRRASFVSLYCQMKLLGTIVCHPHNSVEKYICQRWSPGNLVKSGLVVFV